MNSPSRGLGSSGATLLRMMQRAPVHFREAAEALYPLAAETGAESWACSSAGTLLGRLARAGWAQPDNGKRYQVRYLITAHGEAALAHYIVEVEGDPIVADGAALPEGVRRCWKCERARPIAKFVVDRTRGKVGRSLICRYCLNEQQTERRVRKGLARHVGMAWTKASKEVIVGKVVELLHAAVAARHAGMWRGREAIRAYRDLGVALELFHNGDDLDPAERCEVTPIPIPLAPASDTDWDRRRHSNQRH